MYLRFPAEVRSLGRSPMHITSICLAFVHLSASPHPLFLSLCIYISIFASLPLLYTSYTHAHTSSPPHAHTHLPTCNFQMSAMRGHGCRSTSRAKPNTCAHTHTHTHTLTHTLTHTHIQRRLRGDMDVDRPQRSRGVKLPIPPPDSMLDFQPPPPQVCRGSQQRALCGCD